MPQEFVKAAHTGEILPGQKKLVRIGDKRILLVNVGGSYFAVDGICPHAYAALSIGQLYGDELVCPVHGSAFNLKTGEVLSPPAGKGLTVYPVKIAGDQILINPGQPS